MRLTKIICTLGPASRSREQAAALVKAGMDIARVNLSHGSREEHLAVIRMLKQLNASSERSIGILLDTKGCEIRTGDLKEPLEIRAGQEVVFSPTPLPGEKRPVIHVNYDGFAGDVRETDRILLDNGELTFDIVAIRRDHTVVGRAREDGRIGSRRHINLPGADIDLPSITDKDWDDLAMGVQQACDFVALSFIRTGDEVREVRRFLQKKKSSMQIISKIETQLAVENLRDIVDASDGIMVARGDLGAEIPYERIPAVQDNIVRLCRQAGKPVIVATHMLESMIAHPMPTRAEVTDVAHAAITRADSTMLSGETAMGRNPQAALEAMSRILRETERHLVPPMQDSHCAINDVEARGEAAVTMAQAIKAKGIVVFSRGGKTAQAVSKHRPSVPVLTFTDSPEVQRRLQLFYGIKPFALRLKADPEATVADGFKLLKKAKCLKAGDHIVLVSDAKIRGGQVGTVQIRTIP